jgi:hypothetical protein
MIKDFVPYRHSFDYYWMRDLIHETPVTRRIREREERQARDSWLRILLDVGA